METNKASRNTGLLWVFLFLIIFINGFEAGGYQASLYSIGETYDLSIMNMGLFASVELFATMLAPLILGSWADRTNKIKCLLILLVIQAVFSAALFISNLEMVFVVGIFFLGLTTSALQFIAIAALAEAYPVSGKKKIGFMTSMYALGALISPLFVDFYLRMGISWRTFFVTLAIGSVIAIIGTYANRDTCTEKSDNEGEEESGNTFIVFGVLLLCVVMCIYVGFENGFAFFVDTMFTDVFKSTNGKIALSIFWAVMIPSRILVGYFAKHAKRILIAAIIMIPITTTIISMMKNAGIAMALIVILGFACGAIYPSVLTTMLQFSGNRKATATAMITVSTGVGGVVFTALTGILADAFGIRKAMFFLSAFFILSLASVLYMKKRYK